MLRLTEIQLPLTHSDADLERAVLARLGVAAEALIGYTIFRRSYDARKKSAVTLTYTLDVELREEALVQKALKANRLVVPTPDTSYRFVAQAPAGLKMRPVV